MWVNGSELIKDLLNFGGSEEEKAFKERGNVYEIIEIMRNMQAKSEKSLNEIAQNMDTDYNTLQEILRGNTKEGPTYYFLKNFTYACGFEGQFIYFRE